MQHSYSAFIYCDEANHVDSVQSDYGNIDCVPYAVRDMAVTYLFYNWDVPRRLTLSAEDPGGERCLRGLILSPAGPIL